MTSLSENPALTNPRKALTPSQKDALTAIDFFKFQKPRAGGWAVGNRRFSKTTIETLRTHGFLTAAGGRLNLTQAGKLALDKLKGQSQ
jgi:hypothetical protein